MDVKSYKDLDHAFELAHTQGVHNTIIPHYEVVRESRLYSTKKSTLLGYTLQKLNKDDILLQGQDGIYYKGLYKTLFGDYFDYWYYHDQFQRPWYLFYQYPPKYNHSKIIILTNIDTISYRQFKTPEGQNEIETL